MKIAHLILKVLTSLIILMAASWTIAAPHPIFDNPKAGPETEVNMLIYGDFQCPYTAMMMTSVDQLHADYGSKLSISFSNFPLEFHEQAMPAAIAAVCAKAQGLFWPYAKALMQNQTHLSSEYYLSLAKNLNMKNQSDFAECLKNPAVETGIEKEYDAALARGVDRTPTIWINNQQVVGAYPLSHFKEIIDRELQGY